MPDLNFHLLSGEEVLNSLSNKDILRELKANIGIFNIGTQGPDIFFYYDYKKMKENHSRKIANILHKEIPGDFLKYSLTFTRNLNKNEKEKLFSYLSGYALHYLGDAIVHPYIYYHCGKYPKEDPKFWRHKLFEAEMDIEIVQYIKGVSIYKYNYIKKLSMIKHIPKILIEMYKFSMGMCYGSSLYIEKTIQKAYRDMISSLKYMYDPFGIKRKIIFPVISMVLRFPVSLSVFVYPRKRHFQNILNLSHNLWLHPVTGRKHKESILELFSTLIEKGEKVIGEIFNFLYKDGNMPEIFNKNLSLDTGIPIYLPQDMKYFKSSLLRNKTGILS